MCRFYSIRATTKEAKWVIVKEVRRERGDEFCICACVLLLNEFGVGGVVAREHLVFVEYGLLSFAEHVDVVVQVGDESEKTLILPELVVVERLARLVQMFAQGENSLSQQQTVWK